MITNLRAQHPSLTAISITDRFGAPVLSFPSSDETVSKKYAPEFISALADQISKTSYGPLRHMVTQYDAETKVLFFIGQWIVTLELKDLEQDGSLGLVLNAFQDFSEVLVDLPSS